MSRLLIRDYSNSIYFNGTSSYLSKTSPTGINNGTNGDLTVSGWVNLRTNDLTSLFELHRSGGTGIAFSVGQQGGSYIIFSDRVNGGNNRGLTTAQFYSLIGLNRWVFLTYVLTSTTVTFYANAVTPGTGASFSTPVNAGTANALFLGKGQTTGNVDIQFLNGFMKDWRAFNAALTATQVSELYLNNIVHSSCVSRWLMNENTGTSVADSIGSNSLTLTSGTWVNNSPLALRTATSGRATLAYGTTSAVASMGTITVTDYQYLAGKDATVDVTITDWTAMSGGSLALLGGALTVTEGVDFTAETSNDQTATNLASAIDTAAGESITSVVSNVITISIPGENDGASITWDSGGVTLSSATFTGGFDKTQLNVGSASEPYGTGSLPIGASNDDAATNTASYINGIDSNVTAVAVGSVVTITYNTAGTVGNAWAMSQEGLNGGTISNGISFSGATLSGGLDAIYGRVAVSSRTAP